MAVSCSIFCNSSHIVSKRLRQYSACAEMGVCDGGWDGPGGASWSAILAETTSSNQGPVAKVTFSSFE